MSENKFINKETIGYLQSQTNSTTPQRLTNVEQAIQEIDAYLREQQQFLTDYENYLDAKVSDFEDASTKQQNQLTDTSIQVAKTRLDFKIQIEALEGYVRTAMILALGALLISVIGGITLWLAK